jgi:hypothetical protein
MIGVQFPAEAINISPLHSVQTGSEAHSASCHTETVLFLGNKVAAADVHHPSPRSHKVKNGWGYTSTLPYEFATQWLTKHRNNFTRRLLVHVLLSVFIRLLGEVIVIIIVTISVTIDGGSIGNRMYWTFLYTPLLHFTVQYHTQI